MSLHAQSVTMLLMALSGMTLGTVFDTYRVLAERFRLSRFTLALFDLFYWLGGTLLVFALLYRGNYGEVRLYVFIGLAIGITVYYWLFSHWVERLVLGLIALMIAFYRFVVRLVELLVVKPILAMYRLLKLIFGFLAAFSVFFGKIVLQLTYPILKLLRALFAPLWRPIAKRLPASGVSRLSARLAGPFIRFWRWLFRP